MPKDQQPQPARPGASISPTPRESDYAKVAARLAHPNVVTVLDIGTIDNQVFMAMELVDGGDLRSWLSKSKRGWREVLDIFVQAGRGLAAAHAAGLVHRDFKPENVLIGTDGRPRISDFGLAQLGIASGEIAGTPGYMSPEQLAGSADARSDQLSFCTALYEALYGCLPFDQDDIFDEKGPSWETPRPPQPSDVPSWVQKAVLKGLSLDPQARHADMEALLACLGRDPSRRRRHRLTLVATALVLGICGLAAGALLSNRTQPCRGGEARVAEIWNAERRERISEVFEKAGGASAWARIEPMIGRYLDGWRGAYSDACEATLVRREQSQHLLDLRMTCLERRRSDLDALLSIFGSADARVVGHASEAIQALSGVDACADLESLTAPVALPESREAKLKAEAARAATVQSRALERAGRYPEALARAREATEAARASGWAPALAESLFAEGLALFRSGDSTRAEATFFESAVAAEEGRHYDLLALASSNLAARSLERSGIETARRWARIGLAAGGGSEARSKARHTMGWIEHQSGKDDQAEKWLREALALRGRRRRGRTASLSNGICLI
jgi:tetratricopeptide (TPR) repeat protein